MADFISALTGTQMDSALLDMAEHNSEAYAVGERNGIAVASDDVTYHNNARYYAQIASSQIVGDASSAVRWDTDQSEVLTDAQKAQARENINAASDSDVVKITAQTLTTAQQAQARANIMAGGTNPNLLDNPWFTVRQRGDGPWTGGGISYYTLDRWVLLGGSPNTITAYDEYISVASGNNGIAQFITPELGAFLNGKTVTLSVMDYNGNVASGTLVYSNTALLSTYQITVDGVVCRIYCGLLSGRQLGFSLTVGTGNTVRIKAAKLELGSVSTLANDAPPDYGTELAKCQRYFQRFEMSTNQAFAAGFAQNTTSLRFAIPLPTSLRAQPSSLSFTGSLTARGNGQNLSITAINPTTLLNGSLCSFTATVAGATENAVYILSTSTYPAHIDISADL